MRQRIICLLFIACVVFTGCAGLGFQRGYDEVSRKLLALEDYTCDVKMRVTNNKSTMEYRQKHFYKNPDRYKVEVLAPKELEGQMTIYNGNSACIYHPRINQYLVTENFKDSVEYNSFIGSFMNYIRKSDDIKVSSIKEGEKELFVLEFKVSEANNYMNTGRLWLDPEEITPLKAEIYGNDGKTNVEIYYYNFVCNPGLKDGDFEIIYNIQ